MMINASSPRPKQLFRIEYPAIPPLARNFPRCYFFLLLFFSIKTFAEFSLLLRVIKPRSEAKNQEHKKWPRHQALAKHFLLHEIFMAIMRGGGTAPRMNGMPCSRDPDQILTTKPTPANRKQKTEHRTPNTEHRTPSTTNPNPGHNSRRICKTFR